MFVTDVVEKVNLVLGPEECGSDGMHWCIAPTLDYHKTRDVRR
jgi:hypothetical protein